jgi:hypothetical protein
MTHVGSQSIYADCHFAFVFIAKEIGGWGVTGIIRYTHNSNVRDNKPINIALISGH